MSGLTPDRLAELREVATRPLWGTAELVVFRNAAVALLDAAEDRDRLQERAESLAEEWAIMARACDNWRTWAFNPTDDHDHADWKSGQSQHGYCGSTTYRVFFDWDGTRYRPRGCFSMMHVAAMIIPRCCRASIIALSLCKYTVLTESWRFNGSNGIDGKYFVFTLTRMAKQGRPKKKAAARRGELLQVRVQPGEKQAFAGAAALCGQDVSVWVREALRRAAREKCKEEGLPDPFSVALNAQKE